MTADATSAPALTAWLDDFFASYYRLRPVNATFAGIHDYDHLLPDASPDGFDALRAECRTLLSRLRSLPDESLTPAEQIDRSLAEGFLEITSWELNSPHFAHGNPSLFTGEAIFGILALFLRPFAPLDERVRNAVERLACIPAYLDDARSMLRASPAEWTERALRECVGARAFLGEGVNFLCHQAGSAAEKLRASADRAALAFAGFEAWLRTELLPHPSEDYACGVDVLQTILQRAHCVTISLSRLELYAVDHIESARSYLQAHAADFGAPTPAEALAQLRTLHPPVDRYYSAYRDVAESARRIALDHQLLTWPDFPIEFVPQP
ncbi:MAG TPA: DUF885 family protein, partial [Chloroflexota bacterium]